MLMQYWFPFRGCSPFWFVLGLKIEILAFLGLNATFKRERRRKELCFCFWLLFDFWYGWILFLERKSFLFGFPKNLSAVGFFLSSFSLQKKFFFSKAKVLPQKAKKFCLYRDYPKNPNLPPAVSQTLYRIKGFCCFDFSEDN